MRAFTTMSALPLLLLVATPAGATTGLVCRTAGARPIELSLILGSGAGQTVTAGRLTDNARGVAVELAQAWIDPAELRVELVNPAGNRRELLLRAARRGTTYDGNIWRAGQRRWVRCREG
jgi:hypothetical protein